MKKFKKKAHTGIDRRNQKSYFTTSIRFLTLSIRFWNQNRFSIPNPSQRALRMHQKYLNLCSEDERRSYVFGTTWGCVINDRFFIFGWTIPVKWRYVALIIDCKKHGRSVRDVTRRFLKSIFEKWAEPTATILAARHHASLPDKRKWAKSWDVGEAEVPGCWNHTCL